MVKFVFSNIAKTITAFTMIAILLSIESLGQSNELVNADVVKMMRQKLSPTIVESVVRNSPSNFDTSPAALASLAKAGVPDSVVAAMIEMKKESLPQADPSAPEVQPLGPKKHGIPRVGIVTTQSNVPIEQDEAVRAQIYELLFGNRTTSSIEAILMREKLDRNIASESKITECDYLLYISLESTIKSATERQGNFLQRTVRSGAEAVGAASKMANPLTAFTGITYRSYQMADSLSTSNTLLDTITNATKKKDVIRINIELKQIGSSSAIIPLQVKEITARRDREPILQNLLIQLGNEIANAMPEAGRIP